MGRLNAAAEQKAPRQCAAWHDRPNELVSRAIPPSICPRPPCRDDATVKKNRGKPARLFKELRYQTLNSWSFERRVVAKAEHLPKGANPRFIVTSLTSEAAEAQELYEKIYCARGDMENRIKECQLDLFADRTSAASLRANQLRLWFASLAYVLVTALRRLALQGTELAQATAGTIRLKLLKLGALVTISVRRVKIAITSACPLKGVFVNAHRRLCIAA